MRTNRNVLGIVAVVAIVTGCSSSAGPRTAPTGRTSPIVTPTGTTTAASTTATPDAGTTTAPGTTTAVTTTTAASTTTAAITTTAAATATVVSTTALATSNVIVRPYIDPTICGNGAVATSRSQDFALFPFATGREQPTPLQVLAASSDGVVKPFAVVLRLTASSRNFGEAHSVLINGTMVGITTFANGNGAAAWKLTDGDQAYLRSRGLDQAALVALVTRLTPRDRSAPIPGFDLQPSSDPNALVLLSEHLNTGLSGTVTTFQCQTGVNGSGYRVEVIDGDPVLVYFSIIDAPPPSAVGVNGSGAITINNAGSDTTISLEQVSNADPATWAALPTITQP